MESAVQLLSDLLETVHIKGKDAEMQHFPFDDLVDVQMSTLRY